MSILDKRTASVLAVLLLPVSVGCVPSTPTAVDEVERPSFGVAGGPDVVASIRGGAHYRLNDPPPFAQAFKWIYRFSFQVEKLADGTDHGVVKSRSKIPGGIDAPFPGDWWSDVAVDCVEVEGNTAWISGPIVRAESDTPFGPAEGGYALFIVRDNGPSGPDEINVGPAAAFGVTDCRGKPPIFPGAFTDGNVTVASNP